MNVVVLGSPGVGKGTYTGLTSKRFNLPHISTGDMFRENMKAGTELGIKAKSFINDGLLVPDAVTTEMLKQRLDKPDVEKGFLLEGYPRNVEQAETLKDIVKLDKVLSFFASPDVIIDRLSGRRVCRGCGATYHVKNVPPKVKGVCDECAGELYQREDDNPEKIKKRLEVYENQTAPLIEYYKGEGLLFEVDVSSPYEEREKVIKVVAEVLGV